MRIVQLINPEKKYVIAKVEEPNLRLILNFTTVYDLASYAIQNKEKLAKLIEENQSNVLLNYDDIYSQLSDYKIITPIFHPTDPRFLMVAGTGLTHKASAENRSKMHEAIDSNSATDSMKMYMLGVESGKPAHGQVGIQAEWFYKGNGTVLKGIHESLFVPNYGDDGGEEPEIAGIYINDQEGVPHRIGFTIGNEFSDHVMEKKNYLYLAPSKIRNCSIGPELVLDCDFKNIKGKVEISRKNEIIWEKEIATGEENMCHSLQNLEYHHFKYENHRIPGDINVHFFGTVGFSFGAGLKLENGDEMKINWENMGRPLVNPIGINTDPEKVIEIKQI